MNPNTMNKIIKATRHAREKHPEFAPGLADAMCLAQEELGEVATAINDKAAWEEIEDEIYDTIAVLVRIAEKDYLKSEPEVALFPAEMGMWRIAFPDIPRPELKNPEEELAKAKAKVAALCNACGVPFGEEK